MRERNKCETCIWYEGCDERSFCKDYYPCAGEDVFDATDYKIDLALRGMEYAKLVAEQDD